MGFKDFSIFDLPQFVWQQCFVKLVYCLSSNTRVSGRVKQIEGLTFLAFGNHESTSKPALFHSVYCLIGNGTTIC